MISAIILAAGLSKRMGQPKLLLPWKNTSVLGKVIQTFADSGVDDLLVVTGGARTQVEAIVTHFAQRYPVRSCFNPDYAKGEMLSSLQCGLRTLPSECDAALIGLGDQPQVQERTVRRVCAEYLRSRASLVVPSFQLRRGHPWLVARDLWNELLSMTEPQTPREFLRSRTDKIHYVEVDTASVLEDLDTPEDYASSGHSA